jgi:histidinol dehydrogenase
MKTFIWNDLNSDQRHKALARPSHKDDAAVAATVADIVQTVKTRGDAALREYALRFDKTELTDFMVTHTSLTEATSTIDPQLLAAIHQAKANIEKFHAAEKPKSHSLETMPGVRCDLHWRAIDTIGIYIPGGTAPLFSTVLMQAIPARLAGCKRVILCSPPSRDGKIHPAILATAQLCGITEIFTVGGAQAIAAMAFGTTTIPKVDKICGPGNAYVTLAKQLVAQDPQGAAIDMPAGPSEVMVIAENTARPDWVAADILAQAEHDVNAQAVLVTTDSHFAKQVDKEIHQQLTNLPRRAIAEQSIAASGMIIVADMPTAIEVANLYAPEHLIIHNDDAERWLSDIRHAGSVFLGSMTPESAGDYASGTNHVLPTYGYARAYNGITVLSFMKSMTVQKITKAGLDKLGPIIVTMAEAEGLDAHARAVTIRRES